MLKLFSLFALCVCVFAADKCPQGGQIFARGISDAGKTAVVNAHNNYRLQIAKGEVPNQPKGINLKKMSYDVKLGEEGKKVSDTCEMEHIDGEDARWPFLGQNLFISWSHENDGKQEWDRAVKSWFNEHKDFTYPSTSKGVTGHYTQVVWADSQYIGCDFIYFNDTTMPSLPYAKLYTCNYGPAGNIGSQAPYKTGTSGCENLC